MNVGLYSKHLVHIALFYPKHAPLFEFVPMNFSHLGYDQGILIQTFLHLFDKENNQFVVFLFVRLIENFPSFYKKKTAIRTIIGIYLKPSRFVSIKCMNSSLPKATAFSMISEMDSRERLPPLS